LWFAMSGAIILLGVISLGAQGLNLGIDFKGGTQVSFVTPKPVSNAAVQSQASAIGRPDAVVQGRGTAYPKNSQNFKAFQVRMKTISVAQQNTFNDLLKNKLGVTQQPDSRVVSSSFSSQIARAAILAIIVSLALIALYIWLRFDWKYAVPVLVALAHDI